MLVLTLIQVHQLPCRHFAIRPQQQWYNIYLLIYVDDIIVTGSGVGVVQTFIKLLSQHFSLKDLGTLLYFL